MEPAEGLEVVGFGGGTGYGTFVGRKDDDGPNGNGEATATDPVGIAAWATFKLLDPLCQG